MKMPYDSDKILDMANEAWQREQDENNELTKIKKGYYGMLFFCIPALTISTILWQWIG
jgi:hypothetical protein